MCSMSPNVRALAAQGNEPATCSVTETTRFLSNTRHAELSAAQQRSRGARVALPWPRGAVHGCDKSVLFAQTQPETPIIPFCTRILSSLRACLLVLVVDSSKRTGSARRLYTPQSYKVEPATTASHTLDGVWAVGHQGVLIALGAGLSPTLPRPVPTGQPQAHAGQNAGSSSQASTLCMASSRHWERCNVLSRPRGRRSLLEGSRQAARARQTDCTFGPHAPVACGLAAAQVRDTLEGIPSVQACHLGSLAVALSGRAHCQPTLPCASEHGGNQAPSTRLQGPRAAPVDDV